jgi:hypothetical protein
MPEIVACLTNSAEGSKKFTASFSDISRLLFSIGGRFKKAMQQVVKRTQGLRSRLAEGK